MRVRLLPSSIAGDPQRQCLTTLLVNDCVAIDAGSLGFALTTEEMRAIRDIVITHSHADHTASLPIFISEVFPDLTSPVTVHALSQVINSLHRFVFNDEIWPDFTRIPLRNELGPALEFRRMEPGTPAVIRDLRITPILVNHVVPTAGLILEDERGGFAITSDTYSTDEIWSAAGRMKHLRAVVVDVSYPNDMEDLAIVSKHLTPRSLATDLKKLARDIPIFAVHLKAAYRQAVMRQLCELGDPRISIAEIGRTYEW